MRGFFTALAASFVLLFLASWAITRFDYQLIAAPEYEITIAHQKIIAACDLGDIDLIGDSTANADLIPSRIGAGVRALGLGGSTPVEMYYTVQSLLRCPHLPQAVVFEYVPSSFGDDPAFPFPQQTYFWDKAFAYRVVNYDDAMEILQNSKRFKNALFTGQASLLNIDYRIKSALYSISFPIYFMPDFQLYAIATLAGNNAANHAAKPEIFSQTIRDLGHHFYGMDPQGGVKLDHDANRTDDRISPLTDFYFQRTIEALGRKGVAVYLLEPPRPQTSFTLYPAGLVDVYQDYLTKLQADHPDIRMLGDGLPIWSPVLFGDESHLNLRGSLAFSAMMRNAFDAAGLPGIYPAATLAPQNFYGEGNEASGFWIKPAADSPAAITQSQVSPPPDLAYPARAAVWLYHVQSSASGQQSPGIQAPPSALAANRDYAISVLVKNVNADAVSLQTTWPGIAGKVTWSFTQRAAGYSGMANTLNSGVSFCPNGWVELFITGKTGPVSSGYPGPEIALTGAGATAELYNLTLEPGFWPTNYCKLQPAETQTIPLALVGATPPGTKAASNSDYKSSEP